MIIPDANLLLYAYDSASLFHKKAVEWWRACLSGNEPVGLAPVVVFSFIRIGTNPRVFERPMTAAEAAGHVRSWLAQPVAHVLDTGTGHVEQVFKLLEAAGTAGNLVSDAQLAAIVIEHNAVLHTADTDFMRFPGLRWFNPITNTGSAGLRQRRQP
jgi:toxin-antitoxin system PIN domain toxin